MLLVIKEFDKSKINEIMQIWYETNVEAHSFIPKEYWSNNYEAVKAILPSADVLIYEEEAVKGFIGITDNYYIAGLFVAKTFQGCGIGGLLLDECKRRYSRLELDVYTKNPRSVAFYEKNGFTIEQEKVNTDIEEKEYHMLWSIKGQ